MDTENKGIESVMDGIVDSKQHIVAMCNKKTPEEIAEISAMLAYRSYKNNYDPLYVAILYEILYNELQKCHVQNVSSAWVEALGMLCFGLYNENNDGLHPFEWAFTRAIDDPYAMEIVMLFKNALPEECNRVDHNIQCIKKKFTAQSK